MGSLSLFCPDVILQYSRGMKPPVELQKPKDDLHEWVLGLKVVAEPTPELQKFFATMARQESTVDTHPEDFEESRHDGFWAKTAAGNSEENAANTDNGWKVVKDWLLDCDPPLYAEVKGGNKSTTGKRRLSARQTEAKCSLGTNHPVD